jgi:hypothetical protein
MPAIFRNCRRVRFLPSENLVLAMTTYPHESCSYCAR